MTEQLSKAARLKGIIGFLLILGPFLAGMSAHATWFIPSPSLRPWAALLGFAYLPLLLAFQTPSRRAALFRRFEQQNSIIKQPFLLPGIFLMSGYFSYATFYIALPATITQAFGFSTTHVYEIEEISRNQEKAFLCPYSLHLADVKTVLGDSFCIDSSLAQQLQAGQSVKLHGRESAFGFRFERLESQGP